jgi:hypothetical protein
MKLYINNKFWLAQSELTRTPKVYNGSTNQCPYKVGGLTITSENLNPNLHYKISSTKVNEL